MEGCYSCGKDLGITESDIPQLWWRKASLNSRRGAASGLLFAIHEECAETFNGIGRIHAFGQPESEDLSMELENLYRVKTSVNREFMED